MLGGMAEPKRKLVKRVDKLTAAQRAAIPGYIEKWVTHGLSTQPADRALVERGIRDCYRLAKLPQPKAIVWVSSPVVGALAAPVAAFTIELLRRLKSGATVRDTVGATVRDTVRDTVDATVRATVDATVRATVRATVDATVRATVDATVGDTVRATVDATVGDTVRATVGATVDATVDEPSELRRGIQQAIGRVWSSRWHWRFGGRLWPAWDAWRSFFVDVCGLDMADAKEHYAAWMAAQSAGWWWPFRDFAMVCDTPELIARDAEGRLHSEKGPAVRFRDGWSIYVWHGTRVPAEWIEGRATLDPKTTLTWPNVEQRRAAAGLVGWARVLETVNAKTIDADVNPYIGTLLAADLPDAPGSRFLKVLCATGREFVLPVPREVKTAREGNSWTFGLKPEELELEART